MYAIVVKVEERYKQLSEVGKKEKVLIHTVNSRVSHQYDTILIVSSRWNSVFPPRSEIAS